MSTKEFINVTIEYYKDEDHWLAPSKSIKKISISELLKDIITVEHLHSSYKFHVMAIVFDNYSILIAFKSRTTMESWITKLNIIRGTARIPCILHLYIIIHSYIHFLCIAHL